MYTRNISQTLEKALQRSPVVLLTGARQTGKSTLVKKIGNEKQYQYITFDDLRYLSAAQKDPISFINNLEKPVILDEVQRVPQLFLPIKHFIDDNRKAGTFILTGSANPLLIPHLGDSLAGRMEILKLYPLSQGELQNKQETFAQNVFTPNITQMKCEKLSKQLLLDKLIIGGYPAVQHFNKEDREAWFDAYITTVLQRDVKDLSRIEGIAELPNLLQLLATRTSSLANISELSRTIEISNSTLNIYPTLLETLFLIFFQQPWSTNLGKRLVKSPKVYLGDVGLLLHLLRIESSAYLSDSQMTGKIVETFVVEEILKQLSFKPSKTQMFHYRTQTGNEVDILLEDASGNIVGIEVKSSETVTHGDFKGLYHLKESLGSKFVMGLLLYAGSEKIPFGEKLWAMPISMLWA
jgi:hypothetical protein